MRDRRPGPIKDPGAAARTSYVAGPVVSDDGTGTQLSGVQPSPTAPPMATGWFCKAFQGETGLGSELGVRIGWEAGVSPLTDNNLQKIGKKRQNPSFAVNGYRSYDSEAGYVRPWDEGDQHKLRQFPAGGREGLPAAGSATERSSR